MKSNGQRKEYDSLGMVSVPRNRHWGAQTERARQNFAVGTELMPREIIASLVIIKQAAARVNAAKGLLPRNKAEAIISVCEKILTDDADLWQDFPLKIWQSGSGTQTNMNVNEVIAHRANVKLGSKLGRKKSIHPNDDVNMSQSTNDLFPTAMHLATITALRHHLIPALSALHRSLVKLSKKFNSLVKVGRTHLQDAVPLTLGEEFSGYGAQIALALEHIQLALQPLYHLAIGGTAVGTGLNAPKKFDVAMVRILGKKMKLPLRTATNKFCMLSSHEPLLIISGAVKSLATALFKIVNDIRWLASGPRCGLGELILPSNEPGSSIMPGKVNPTQCEMVLMVCAQVMGNDATISFANAQGDFELNVFKPVIIYNLLQAINLLGDALVSFNRYALAGLQANRQRQAFFVKNSLMAATALNPIIGYDRVCDITRLALRRDITLREACAALGYMDLKEFDHAMGEK